ncbi:odorant receptor 131-2-like [Pelodytes ibericus]
MVNLTDVQSNATYPVVTAPRLNIGFLWMVVLTPTLICFFCFLYIIVIMLHVYFSTSRVQENSRYVLFAHMLINDSVYMAIAVLLMVLSMYDVLFQIPTCYILVTVSSTSFKVTPYNLAVMSLERYVAICFPLRHGEICTRQNSAIVIALIWTVGLIPNVVDFIILASSVRSDYFSRYVHCSRNSIQTTAAQNILRSFIHAFTFSLVGLVIVFTYIKITLVAMKIDAGNVLASKAGKTVMLHAIQLLLCMMAFSYPITEMYLRQYSVMIPAFNFCIFMCLPRFLSPLIYGIRDDVFRPCIRKYILFKPVRIEVIPLKGQYQRNL